MTKKQQLVLIIAILASCLTFLDGSVVSVALPSIARELGGGLILQQWVNSAYFITLSSLILAAGSISDLFGRKKVLLYGIVGFGITSLLCACAPTAETLIGARALQGIFGALLIPGSLAMIIDWFNGESQGKAIGSWTAWTGIAYIIGPLVGGSLVDSLSWRWVFLINIIPTLITLWLLRRLPADHPVRGASVDWIGTVGATIGLGATVYALIEQPVRGWTDPYVLLPLIIGVIALITFLFWQRIAKQPMLPLALFKNQNFSVGNLATVAIYAGLSIATFIITIFVQQVGHYSALSAGLTVLPVTIIMFSMSSRFGMLAGRLGPRLFMTIGPICAGVGFLYLLFVDQSINYWTQIFPGIVLFGFGLSMTVAPLTLAVLGGADRHHAGIESAVNNAVSRIASLLAVASIGLVVGQSIDLDGFHHGAITMAALLFIGGIISAIGIKNPAKK